MDAPSIKEVKTALILCERKKLKFEREMCLRKDFDMRYSII